MCKLCYYTIQIGVALGEGVVTSPAGNGLLADPSRIIQIVRSCNDIVLRGGGRMDPDHGKYRQNGEDQSQT